MACDNEKYLRSVLNYDLFPTRFPNLKSLEVGEGSPFQGIEEGVLYRFLAFAPYTAQWRMFCPSAMSRSEDT